MPKLSQPPQPVSPGADAGGVSPLSPGADVAAVSAARCARTSQSIEKSCFSSALAETVAFHVAAPVCHGGACTILPLGVLPTTASTPRTRWITPRTPPRYDAPSSRKPTSAPKASAASARVVSSCGRNARKSTWRRRSPGADVGGVIAVPVQM
jgi:hypothetical protein